MQRLGDWIQTFTGRQFWPLDPIVEDIDIEDIAHALSMLCRYGGHCKRFYSVAEHSVLVASMMPPNLKLHALLHDASEAYLVDMPRPLKNFIPEYRRIEAILEAAVAFRFNLSGIMPAAIKEADNRILMDERNALMRNPPSKWTEELEPLGVQLQFWTPAEAKQAFLQAFELAQQGRGH